jgi:SAM-dependent methyltransferase
VAGVGKRPVALLHLPCPSKPQPPADFSHCQPSMRIVSPALFWMARMSGGLSTLLHYFGASTLRLADLKTGIQHSWQDFNPHDAEIVAGLMPWEDDLLQRFAVPGASMLIVGCGSGRDLVSLVQRGYRVTGVDPAAAALATAQRILRERQLSATLVEGFFEDVQLTGPFDVVWFSYFSYSYIPVSSRRIGVLRKAATHLAPSGHVLLSYPGVSRPRPIFIRLGRIAGRLSGSDWRLEAGDYVVPQRAASGFFYSFAHAFQPAELQAEVSAAGLEVAYRRDPPADPVMALRRAVH